MHAGRAAFTMGRLPKLAVLPGCHSKEIPEMPKAPGAIAPDRQRRFDRAFQALAELCPGRERRLSDYKVAPYVAIDPLTVETARSLLHAMALSRDTAGGRAISLLARRGYAIRSDKSLLRQTLAVLPLDEPELLFLGHVLPSRRVPWKSLEAAALATDPASLTERRWCSAHETLALQSVLMAQGHVL
jgi:hypothetical protein